MKIFHIATLSIAALMTMGASAQSLKQEITIDHVVVPESNDVNRLNVSPTLDLPTMGVRNLEYSHRPVSITVPSTINQLDPIAWADTIYTSPWRGYAMAGIMPLYNADLTAGYKFVDNDHTRFAGFMQYNGSVYRGRFPSDQSGKEYVRNHTATIDLILHQAVGSKSFIDAGVDFSYAHYNMPGLNDLSDVVLKSQNMRRIGVQATFSSWAKEVNYTAGVKYRNFGFTNCIIPETPKTGIFEPVAENFIGLSGTAKFALDDKMSSVGAKVNLDILNNNRRTDSFFSFTDRQYHYHDYGKSYTHALLSLNPYYRFDYQNLRLNIGARLDFTFNSGKAVHIAPDVLISWRPSWLFAIQAKAGGGEHQNSLNSLYGVTPYAQSMMCYKTSHVPFTFDLGMTLGPWRGAYLELGGGYARANDWLMPVTDASNLTIFKPIDMRGFYWSIEAGYEYKRLGKLTVRYEGTEQGYEKGYYLWHDRAKSVFNAELKVTPIKPLDVTVGYELRSGRTMIDQYISSDPLIPSYYSEVELGNISDLNIGASYRFTEQLSAFITGNNLLNTKYRHIGLMPGQGLHGLIGVSYKF